MRKKLSAAIVSALLITITSLPVCAQEAYITSIPADTSAEKRAQVEALDAKVPKSVKEDLASIGYTYRLNTNAGIRSDLAKYCDIRDFDLKQYTAYTLNPEYSFDEKGNIVWKGGHIFSESSKDAEAYQTNMDFFHEIGHAYSTYLYIVDYAQTHRDKAYPSYSITACDWWRSIYTAESKKEAQSILSDYIDYQPYVLQNPDEYFAEAFRAYVDAPEKLKAAAPNSYNFVDICVNSPTDKRLYTFYTNIDPTK